MLIERSSKQARIFNLDLNDDLLAYNEVISDPATRILEKKYIAHTEIDQSGRDRTETKETHILLEWETCSL